jgi:photosynthetic reaction center cytochrome c subunit
VLGSEIEYQVFEYADAGGLMKSGWALGIQVALGMIVACVIGVATVSGQAGVAEKPLLAEQVFKNVQVLRGVSVGEFMDTMGFLAASLDANCTTCHGEAAVAGANWDGYAADVIPAKQTARMMMVMVNALNQSYFGGRQVVTCYSCHRFGKVPKIVPELAMQYSNAPEQDPDEVVAQVRGRPSPDQVLDDYFKAIGGAAKVAGINSVVAKGTWQGYEDTEQHSLQIYAKAPDQRMTVVDNHGGLTTNTYDGRNGWLAAPFTDVPVTLVALGDSDLDNARVDAQLSFPGRIKQSLTDLRVGRPFVINDRDITIVQGYSAGKSPVKLYFDDETKLLVRVVRFTNTKLGRQPTQFDYSDYRDVNGIKIPFHWVTTWVNGRSKTQLSEVQFNVPIDGAKFAKPAAPKP